MFNFSSKFAWANVLSLALVFSSLSPSVSGLSCWECDDNYEGKVDNYRRCWWDGGNGPSKPCDIPNGMCVSECVFELYTDIARDYSRQTCSNDTSIVGEPGKCGKGEKQINPELKLTLTVCSCTTDDCNRKLSCYEEHNTEIPTTAGTTPTGGGVFRFGLLGIAVLVISLVA
ncbi:hypothetical protein Ocin01_17079 [Orchesella cincta]|uniref:Uncharacterized protein n=1 Tax=Orchesella cincta TaxID=48709 RepID=A0A1D2M9N8_ORCCI|nr:hypothetical protein Ocin01_17079 [Orchesella cincta]